MVSFSCESCGDVLTKGKLDKHRGHCRGASFTCLDCMVHFTGSSYKSHSSCISESQKYEGALYKGKDKKNKLAPPNQQTSSETAMIPRKAYVEDEGDTEMGDAAVAVIDVPPRAPSPPTANDDLPPGTNVYDFLVSDNSQALARSGSHMIDTQASIISDDSHFVRHGFSYGDAPLKPNFDRHDSYSSLVPHTGSQSLDRDGGQHYLTPAPSRGRDDDRGKDDRRSDKKRKRQQIDDLDTSRMRQTEEDALAHMHGDARPPLHSGLTGGLSRLLTRPVDEFERQAGLAHSPLSPMKRSRRDERHADQRKTSGEAHRHASKRDDHAERNGDRRGRNEHRKGSAEYEEHKHKTHRQRRRGSSSSEDERRPPRDAQKAIEYRKTSAEPASNGQLIQYRNPAEHFLSFVKKGIESERGMSVNKVLKRYHRERESQGVKDKETHDKELWKELRVRRNERGEIVLFM